MAEITRKRTGELLRTLFEILKQYPDGLKANHALAQLAASVEMTPHEKGMYESNGTSTRRFEKIVRFATIDCVKAGWLVKHKGTWVITAEGTRAYEMIKDPESFYREAVKLYQKWKTQNQEASPKSNIDKNIEEVTLEENNSVTFEQAEEQAWAEVEKFLKSMNPYEFQDLVADLLKGMGYFVSWISPPGKDAGVDIIAHPDPLGTQVPRLKVQVKRHADVRVDRQTVQSFISTIGDDDAGLFVATSGFTKDAEEHVRSQERRMIMLIDWEKFFELWIQFQHKLDDNARRKFPITPIYFLTLKN